MKHNIDKLDSLLLLLQIVNENQSIHNFDKEIELIEEVIDDLEKKDPWVTLTSQERRLIRKCNQSHEAYANAIEAELRRKNGFK